MRNSRHASDYEPDRRKHVSKSTKHYNLRSTPILLKYSMGSTGSSQVNPVCNRAVSLGQQCPSRAYSMDSHAKFPTTRLLAAFGEELLNELCAEKSS